MFFHDPPSQFKEFSTRQVSMILQKKKKKKTEMQWMPEGLHVFKTTIATNWHRTHLKERGIDLVPKEYQSLPKYSMKPSSRRFPKARNLGSCHRSQTRRKTLCRESLLLGTIIRRKRSGCSFRESGEGLHSTFQLLPGRLLSSSSGERRQITPCQDYRRLNDKQSRQYPLPLIPELIDKLKGAQIFTKLDLRWGYNNVQSKKRIRFKAAFVADGKTMGTNRYVLRTPKFPGNVSSMMNALFDDLIKKEGHHLHGRYPHLFQESRRNTAFWSKGFARLEEEDLF